MCNIYWKFACVYVHGCCKGSRALTNLQVCGTADVARLDWAPVFLNLSIQLMHTLIEPTVRGKGNFCLPVCRNPLGDI